MKSAHSRDGRGAHSSPMLAALQTLALAVFILPLALTAAAGDVKGWHLDGEPLVQKEKLIDLECYAHKTLVVSAVEGTGTGSVAFSPKCFKEGSGTYTGYIHWTVPPSFLQPGTQVGFTMSASTTGGRTSMSGGLIKANNGTLLEAYDTSAKAINATYTVPEGAEGSKLELYVSFMAAGNHANVTYNYVYRNEAKGAAPIAKTPPAAQRATWPSRSLWSETGLANKITIEITGGKVLGSYEYKDGKMDGALSADGKTISGHWKQTNSSGRYSLTIADDGRSFSGKICYGEGDPLKTGWGWEATLSNQ
jgi:hypothetical protein